MIVSRKFNKTQHPPLTIQTQTIDEITSHKHLGAFFLTPVLGIPILTTSKKKHGQESIS